MNWTIVIIASIIILLLYLITRKEGFFSPNFWANNIQKNDNLISNFNYPSVISRLVAFYGHWRMQRFIPNSWDLENKADRYNLIKNANNNSMFLFSTSGDVFILDRIDTVNLLKSQMVPTSGCVQELEKTPLLIDSKKTLIQMVMKLECNPVIGRLTGYLSQTGNVYISKNSFNYQDTSIETHLPSQFLYDLDTFKSKIGEFNTKDFELSLEKTMTGILEGLSSALYNDNLTELDTHYYTLTLSVNSNNKVSCINIAETGDSQLMFTPFWATTVYLLQEPINIVTAATKAIDLAQ